jgi:hypothetical protein
MTDKKPMQVMPVATPSRRSLLHTIDMPKAIQHSHTTIKPISLPFEEPKSPRPVLQLINSHRQSPSETTTETGAMKEKRSAGFDKRDPAQKVMYLRAQAEESLKTQNRYRLKTSVGLTSQFVTPNKGPDSRIQHFNLQLQQAQRYFTSASPTDGKPPLLPSRAMPPVTTFESMQGLEATLKIIKKANNRAEPIRSGKNLQMMGMQARASGFASK